MSNSHRFSFLFIAIIILILDKRFLGNENISKQNIEFSLWWLMDLGI